MAEMMQNRCSSCFEPKGGSGPCPGCGWDAENPGPQSTQRLKPGTVLNGVYTVGKVLGQGGFGITYLAWDLHGGRKVAIKECFPDNPRAERTTDGRTVTCSGADRGEKALFEAAVAKFIQEASTLSQFYLEPEIVNVLGVFRENNTAYMVMEYLEGHSLAEEIKRMKRLSAERVEEVALSVCRGLKAVHGKGILHRDVSPDNIFVTDCGAIKLIDFGTARDMGGNRTLTVNLKHGYAPKEQYTGRNQGPWTDIYALGATLYRALTGKMPPRAEEREVDDGIRSPSELGLKLPERLEAAVMKALSVEIEERFGDVSEFVEALTDGEVTLEEGAEDEEDLYTQKTVWYRGPEKTVAEERKGPVTKPPVPTPTPIVVPAAPAPVVASVTHVVEPVTPTVFVKEQAAAFQKEPEPVLEKEEPALEKAEPSWEEVAPSATKKEGRPKGLILAALIGLLVLGAFFLMSNDQGGTTASSGGSQAASQAGDSEPSYTPEETVRLYYSGISEGQYGVLYDQVFSENRKSKITKEGFTSGFRNTISVTPLEVRTTRQDDSTARVAVKIKSLDRSEAGGPDIEKVFEGEWVLVKSDGQWLLDRSNMRQVSVSGGEKTSSETVQSKKEEENKKKELEEKRKKEEALRIQETQQTKQTEEKNSTSIVLETKEESKPQVEEEEKQGQETKKKPFEASDIE